jgi:hypothetical protein
LASGLCQTVGDGLFFTWHIFLQVDKTQDLPSKIWQTLEVAIIGLLLDDVTTHPGKYCTIA